MWFLFCVAVPRAREGQPLKVFSDLEQIPKFLTSKLFTISTLPRSWVLCLFTYLSVLFFLADNMAEADVLWLYHMVTQDTLRPGQLSNQFPDERVLVWKNHLFRTVNGAFGQVPYVVFSLFVVFPMTTLFYRCVGPDVFGIGCG